jgi:hypothetical protein
LIRRCLTKLFFSDGLEISSGSLTAVVNEKGYVMNAKNIKGFLVAAIVITSGMSVLAVIEYTPSITKRLTIPFTFAAGKPIKASDLNANFGAVKKTLEGHDHSGEFWNAGTGPALNIRSSYGFGSLTATNTGTGPGIIGYAENAQAAGVRGSNNAGVGVWGTSYLGNGGYFETSSNRFPSVAIRQNGGHHLIDAYGPGDAVPELRVLYDGTILTNGNVWANAVYSRGIALTSDRNAKKNFSSIDPQNVLEKVAALPITRWNYKQDASSIAHVGPMAQDFHAAFGLNGGDDKHISVVDAQGVALAAIQGLNQKLEAEKAENAKLRSSLTDLEKRLAALERK